MPDLLVCGGRGCCWTKKKTSVKPAFLAWTERTKKLAPAEKPKASTPYSDCAIKRHQLRDCHNNSDFKHNVSNKVSYLFLYHHNWASIISILALISALPGQGEMDTSNNCYLHDPGELICHWHGFIQLL
jgi:hypothetical protein